MIPLDEMAAFCKRKGFVYNAAEIYGGLAGFSDYGPYGVELKKNIANAWWKFMVQSRQDVAGIDGAIISPEAVWKASGHLSSGFSDVMLPCTKCKNKVRADVFIEEKTKEDVAGKGPEEMDAIVVSKKLKCPACGSPFGKASRLNLMFPITIGTTDNGVTAYLRGETCQMIYLNFKLVQQNARMKLPFGIAQIGKAFRNEISPRNFLFRMREFEQMEMQFFIDGSEEKKWFDYWKKQRMSWLTSLGVDAKKLRFRPHAKDELAHYAKQAEDIEFEFPFGWKEIEGIHNRGDWDLGNHSKHSGKALDYFDEESKKSITPHIIETSAGLDRTFLTILYNAYDDDKKRENIVLHLHPKLAPVKVGVFPLVKKLEGKAKEVYESLRHEFVCFYDEAGSIGRRYARMDELGTPFCVTIDFETLEDGSVTIRDRDSTSQKRVKLSALNGELARLLSGEKF